MTMQAAPAGPDPLPASTAQALLHLLGQRFSTGPKYLAAPGPTMEAWMRAARVAERAPDHGALRPFRFVIVGDDQRLALSELFAQGALERGQPPDDVERARARAFNGPWAGRSRGPHLPRCSRRAGARTVDVRGRWTDELLERPPWNGLRGEVPQRPLGVG